MRKRLSLLLLLLLAFTARLFSSDAIENGIREAFSGLMDPSGISIEVKDWSVDDQGLFKANVTVEGKLYFLACLLDLKKDQDSQIENYCHQQFSYEAYAIASQSPGFEPGPRIDYLNPLSSVSLEKGRTLLDASDSSGRRVGVLIAHYKTSIAYLDRIWASELMPGARLEPSSLIGLDIKAAAGLASASLSLGAVTPMAPFIPLIKGGLLFSGTAYAAMGIGYYLALDPLIGWDFTLISNARLALEAYIGAAWNPAANLLAGFSASYQHFLGPHLSWGLEYSQMAIGRTAEATFAVMLGASL